MRVFRPQTVDRTGEAFQLRLRFLRSAAAMIGIFTLISVGISLADPKIPANTIILQIGLIIACAIAYWLGRRGFDTVGGILLSIALIIAISFAGAPQDLIEQPLGVSYIIAIMVAGMVAGPGATIFTSALSLAILTYNVITSHSSSTAVYTTMLIIVVTGGLAWFVFRSQNRLLMNAQEQTQNALNSQHQLEEREQALMVSYNQLSEANQLQADMLKTIAELETPAIPLLDGVLVVPLVGHLDSRRMEHLSTSVLNSIHTRKVHTLIIDITGVQVIDTAVAKHIQGLGQAARLLGTRVMLTGISAEVATTVVMLGLDFGNFDTRAHLQDGVLKILQLRN
jgi:rsbT co-antagonist protein RsbR